MAKAELDHFFRPESIAIIGASSTPGKVGYNFMANLVASSFPHEIYPVNPGFKEIMGIRVYEGIKDVPKTPDLAIIAVSQSLVPSILLRCADKGIKAVIISSAGFGDDGQEGKKLERDIVEIAKKRGMRIIGPNTQGLINPDRKLALISTSPKPLAKIIEGRVSYICQTAFFYWDWIINNTSLGLSKAVDLGNMCDVNHSEVLDYLGSDPKTQVLSLHIEGLRDGAGFVKTATKVTRQKPVIVLKAGRSVEGARAIASHTGSLAGKDETYDAAFKQAGIIRAADMDELIDLTKTFAYLPALPTGNRVGIITFSGAAGSLAADACAESNLRLAKFSKATINKMSQIFPSWASAKNPMDVFQIVTINAKAVHSAALESLSTDPNLDAILIVAMTVSTAPEFNPVDVLREYAEKGIRKPTVVCGLRDEEGLKQLVSLESRGLLTYSSIRRAAKALAASYHRYRYLNS